MARVALAGGQVAWTTRGRLRRWMVPRARLLQPLPACASVVVLPQPEGPQQGSRTRPNDGEAQLSSERDRKPPKASVDAVEVTLADDALNSFTPSSRQESRGSGVSA